MLQNSHSFQLDRIASSHLPRPGGGAELPPGAAGDQQQQQVLASLLAQISADSTSRGRYALGGACGGAGQAAGSCKWGGGGGQGRR